MFSQKPNTSICHNWANGIVSPYKKYTGEGTHFFYDGKTIYSYGRHFPIAVIHKDKKRGDVVFFTTRTYSNTTSGHIGATRQACSHLNVIYCKVPTSASNGNHTENLEDFEESAKASAKKLASANKPEIYLNAIANELERAQKYANYFKIKLTAKKYPNLFITGTDEQIKGIKERKAKEVAKQKKQFKESLHRFRTFTNTLGEFSAEIPTVYTNGNDAYLRYNKASKRVETSKDIQIPAEMAKRFYKWIKQVGECDGNCAMTILDFKVERVSAKEFKVGCHTIQMSEADAIAKQLNW